MLEKRVGISIFLKVKLWNFPKHLKEDTILSRSHETLKKVISVLDLSFHLLVSLFWMRSFAFEYLTVS